MEDNLKRKLSLLENRMGNNDSPCSSNTKHKHPRLLMRGQGKESSHQGVANHLVIEFPMDSRANSSGSEENKPSAQFKNPSAAKSCEKEATSKNGSLQGLAQNGHTHLNGNSSKKKEGLDQKMPLASVPSFDLYSQLVPYAKGGLDTECLPTSTADALTAQRLCSLRLCHLMELVQKGNDVGKEEIIKNLKYAKHVIETIPTSQKARRNSDQTHIHHGHRGYLEDDDGLDEVAPDAVPTEVRDWLAQTFTKAPTNPKTKRGERPTLKSVINVVRAGLLVDRMYRRTTSLSPDHHKTPPPEVVEILKGVADWEFDIWELNKISENRALRYIGFDVIQRERLICRLKVNPACLDNFLAALEVGYSKFNNPYHNLIHGADVTQTTYYLLHASNLLAWLTDVELLAILIAALIHDYEHTGTTNSYHIMTGSRLARLYNDKSVLENHHISSAFELLRSEERNILANLSKDQYGEFRALVIDMVLATDMTNHSTLIKDMRSLLACPKSLEKSKVLSLLLHAADISHPAKPWKVHKPWTDRLIQEFFNQGDTEKELGLACSPLCDRNTTVVEDSQIVFIDIIVQPTMNLLGDVFEKIADLFPSSQKESWRLARPWEKNIDINKNNWIKLSKEAVDENKNIKGDFDMISSREDNVESKSTVDTSPEPINSKQAVLAK